MTPEPRTPFLVADIGGTHARFASADRAGVHDRRIRLATADYRSSADLVAAALRELGVREFAAACIAVAGPVRADRARLSQSGLEFDRAALSRQLGCAVTLINDFHALARSLPCLSRTRQIGGRADATGTRVVLGPGTGLGVAALIETREGRVALPSEGGQMDLAPGSALEAELLQWLQRELGHVSWESVVSGPGLVRLYRAVCALWGAPPAEVTPEWISAQGVEAADPVCHQTLELFFGFLGAAAGNQALGFCAWGGVYLAGGILPGLEAFAVTSPLRRRFDERGHFRELVCDVPLYLILDPEPGLLGALECLRQGLFK